MNGGAARSTVAAMNLMAGGEAVRIPTVRVEKVHENRDYIPDAIDISISFPTRDFEAIRQASFSPASLRLSTD